MKKFTLLLIFAITASLFFGSNAFGQTITLRGSNNGTTTGGTLTITKPSGLALDDVMIVAITQGENASAGSQLANATAAGWALIQGTSFGLNGNTARQATILYKVADADDVAAADFDFAVSDPGTDRTAGTLAAFFNVSPLAPIEATGAWGTGSGTTVTAPGMNTTSANAGLLMFAFTGDNTTYSTWSSPFTSTTTSNNDGGSTQDVAVGRGFGLQAAAGATGNKTVGQTDDPWAGILVALKPASPTVNLTPAAQTVATGAATAFTAATSYFPSGGTLTYTWTVTPSAGVTITGTGASRNITFANAGNYTISVLVTHSTGPSATSNTATVSAAGPNSPIGCNGNLFISYATGTAGYANTTTINQLSYNGSVFTTAGYSVAPTGIGFNGMGLNPVDGYIYAIRYSTGAPSTLAHLVKVGTPGGSNITDLTPTGITGLAANETVYAGAFDANGDFYFAVSSNKLMKITNADLQNGAPFTAVQVGATNSVWSTLADIAINPVTGQMVGTANANATNFLYPNIDKVAGTPGTAVGGNLGNPFFAGLFFNEAGSLFGYRSDGGFYGISPTGSLSPAGSTSSYNNADGCNCSFRVGHTLNRGAFCPSAANPTPDFPVTIALSNNSGQARSPLTFTLNISDPSSRFRFVQAGTSTPASATAIAQALFTAGLLPDNSASHVVFTAEAPATGTNYNKVVINGLIAPYPTTAAHQFVFNVEFYTAGGIYSPVNFQSIISGLPSGLGSTDLSDNVGPGPKGPDAPTVIQFNDCGNITLPVKLLSFTGVTRNDVNTLTWVVENEINFDHYELERSIDGRNFAPVSMKQAAGSLIRQQYGYGDDVTLNSEKTFYYRLKMVDIDGKFIYSNVILLRKNDKLESGLVISPNPIVNNSNTATARIVTTTAGKVELSVIDMSGKVVLSQENQVYEGVNSIAVTNINRLLPGIYLLKMNNGEKIETTKFSVVR